MEEHKYIAYSGYMVSGGTADWQEEVAAASPAAALQKATTAMFAEIGTTQYPKEFGINLATAEKPAQVIAGNEFDSRDGGTYRETAQGSMVVLHSWQAITSYLSPAYEAAQAIVNNATQKETN